VHSGSVHCIQLLVVLAALATCVPARAQDTLPRVELSAPSVERMEPACARVHTEIQSLRPLWISGIFASVSGYLASAVIASVIFRGEWLLIPLVGGIVWPTTIPAPNSVALSIGAGVAITQLLGIVLAVAGAVSRQPVDTIIRW
jgi:hypothetical protein